MAALLTPGLTPFQRQQVADVLSQIGAVPMGQMASLFVDVDVAAARALNIRRPSRRDCLAVAAELAGEHQINPLIVSFAYGLAIGVRQGRTFAPKSAPRSKAWISEEYRQLHEDNRRTAAKFIRQLLKAQGAPRLPGARPDHRQHVSTRAEAEIQAARRWTKEAGRLARKGG